MSHKTYVRKLCTAMRVPLLEGAVLDVMSKLVKVHRHSVCFGAVEPPTAMQWQ